MKENKSFIQLDIEKSDLYVILMTLISGLITHFYLYANNVLAPDAVATGNYKIAGNWEFSLGRWGIVFFDKLRGGMVNEFIIVLISLTFLGLAAAIICKIFKVEKRITKLLIALLLAVAPQFSETFCFIYCADSYCFAMLSAVTAVYFIKTQMPKNINYFLGIICIVISLSLYQAYVAITVSLLIIYSIIELLRKNEWKSILSKLFIEMTIVLIGMAVYLGVTKIILKIMGLTFASYKGASSMGIRNIIVNLKITLKSTYTSLFDYLFKEGILYNKYWKREILNTIILLIILLLISFNIKRNRIYKNWQNLLLILLLLILMPIGINIINIIMPDTKINIVTGPALIIPYIFVMLLLDKEPVKNICKQIFTLISTGIIFILLWTFICSDNATYFAREEVYRNYFSTMSNIYARIQQIDGYNRNMSIMFSDNVRFTSKFASIANGTISNDYETWDNIDGIWMNQQFFSTYLGENIKMCTKDEYYEIIQTKEFKNMNQYPDDGCIKIINDIIVVKISNHTY